MQLFIEKWKLNIISGIAWLLMSIFNRTLRLKVIDNRKNEKLKNRCPVGGKKLSSEYSLFTDNQVLPGGILYSFWHRTLWVIIYYFRHREMYTLASLSKDGEYITRVISKLGWRVIRGSSSRGSIGSLKKLCKVLEKGNQVALTPDGPRGPALEVKPGIVYLQEKTGAAIIPLGLVVSHCRVFNSWDRFVLPYPFSRVVLVIGRELYLNSEKTVVERCQLLAEKMAETQKEAEKVLN